jgi:hypothetical protein
VSTPSALVRPRSGTVGRRLAARIAVLVARGLAMLPPKRIRSVLTFLRQGARPAGYTEAKAARDTILSVSLRCLGPQGCLPRSLATVVLCRLSGRWPTWCVGVRVAPPFGAHAWVEADGRMVDEPMPDGYLARLMAVPPRATRPSHDDR